MNETTAQACRVELSGFASPRKEHDMGYGTAFVHWMVMGFAAGLGYALAIWILGKVLR